MAVFHCNDFSIQKAGNSEVNHPRIFSEFSLQAAAFLKLNSQRNVDCRSGNGTSLGRITTQKAIESGEIIFNLCGDQLVKKLQFKNSIRGPVGSCHKRI
jgi:hypothetical protein